MKKLIKEASELRNELSLVESKIVKFYVDCERYIDTSDIRTLLVYNQYEQALNEMIERLIDRTND